MNSENENHKEMDSKFEEETQDAISHSGVGTVVLLIVLILVAGFAVWRFTAEEGMNARPLPPEREIVSRDELQKMARERVSLRLAGTTLSETEWKILKEFKALTFLELEGDNPTLTDDGIAHIASIGTLTQLTIWNSSMTDKGLEMLAGLSKLTELSLDGNRGITDEGVSHLSKLKELTLLSLDFNPQLTRASLGHLKAMPKLRHVFLTELPLTDADVPTLLEMQINRLSICETGISETGYNTLTAAFPEGLIYWP